MSRTYPEPLLLRVPLQPVPGRSVQRRQPHRAPARPSLSLPWVRGRSSASPPLEVARGTSPRPLAVLLGRDPPAGSCRPCRLRTSPGYPCRLRGAPAAQSSGLLRPHSPRATADPSIWPLVGLVLLSAWCSFPGAWALPSPRLRHLSPQRPADPPRNFSEFLLLGCGRLALGPPLQKPEDFTSPG